MSPTDNMLMEIDNFSTLQDQLQTEKRPCFCKECQNLNSSGPVSFVSLPNIDADTHQMGDLYAPISVRAKHTKSAQLSPIVADDLPSPKTRWKNILKNQLRKSKSYS